MKGLETGFDVVVALVKEVRQQPGSQGKAHRPQRHRGRWHQGLRRRQHRESGPEADRHVVPGAGFISAIISIYDTIKVFIDKLTKIIATVKAFLDRLHRRGGRLEAAEQHCRGLTRRPAHSGHPTSWPASWAWARSPTRSARFWQRSGARWTRRWMLLCRVDRRESQDRGREIVWCRQGRGQSVVGKLLGWDDDKSTFGE